VVRQALQFGLPKPSAVAVGAAAVGGDRQLGSGGVSLPAEVILPALDRGDGKLRGPPEIPTLTQPSSRATS
jgi:hypothetical protein